MKFSFALHVISILSGSFHPILITVDIFYFLLTFSTVNAVIYLKIIVLELDVI